MSIALSALCRRVSQPVAPNRLKFPATVSMLLAVFALLALPAHATTYTVTDLTDNAGDSGSIRSAVNSVDAGTGGDTIDFSGAGASGTITLTGTLTLSKNVTITGPGENLLTISGGGAVTVFTVSSGVTASISGLTITDGSSGAGGGIYNGGTLTVTNSTFSGNAANQTWFFPRNAWWRVAHICIAKEYAGAPSLDLET